MARAFTVVHSMLGNAGHRAGEVVEFTDDHIKKDGVDIAHLLDIGAIREATSEEAKKSVVYGQSGASDVKPFPAVPYSPTAPEGLPAPEEKK